MRPTKVDKERGGVVDWQRDRTFVKEDGYYVDLIGDEAVKLIDGHEPSTPLFLYFGSLAPMPHIRPLKPISRLTKTCSRTRCPAPTPR